jgi:hypothetical protein
MKLDTNNFTMPLPEILESNPKLKSFLLKHETTKDYILLFQTFLHFTLHCQRIVGRIDETLLDNEIERFENTSPNDSFYRDFLEETLQRGKSEIGLSKALGKVTEHYEKNFGVAYDGLPKEEKEKTLSEKLHLWGFLVHLLWRHFTSA